MTNACETMSAHSFEEIGTELKRMKPMRLQVSCTLHRKGHNCLLLERYAACMKSEQATMDKVRGWIRDRS